MQINVSKNFFLRLKNLLLFASILLINQSCTSSIEVAANLGKKYIIPKD